MRAIQTFWFILLVMGFAFLLASCSTASVAPIIDDKIKVQELDISHPQRPLPVQKVSIKWQVFNINENTYIALSYNDSIEFRKLLEDMKRYILEQKEMLCFYRKSLKETVCEIENDDTKSHK